MGERHWRNVTLAMPKKALASPMLLIVKDAAVAAKKLGVRSRHNRSKRCLQRC
jgi:hypothetical protein